jgi:hypothetical protein
MVRYFFAAVVGCLYVAGSIWVVSTEGKAYRDELSKTKLAAHLIEKPSLAGPGGTARTGAEKPWETSSARTEPAPVKPAPARSADASEHPAGKRPRAPKPAIEVAATKPAAAPPAAKRATGRPGGAAAVPANPLLNDPFWSQAPLTRNWDVSSMNADDELRLGADLHLLIVHFNPLVEDGPWLSRVEDAAEPLLKMLIRKDINYKFFILNSDAVNAFSTPGGYVYVSRGLFDLIGEDDDDALQFAVGHEIGHVDLQHAIRCLQDAGVRKMTEGTLQKLYLLIIPFGYLVSDTVDQELKADEWVMNRMQRLERTRREILVFLQKFEGYAKSRGFENGRAKPQPGREISPPENHYRSQTAARKRLKHLKELMDQGAGSAR